MLAFISPNAHGWEWKTKKDGSRGSGEGKRERSEPRLVDEEKGI
jgi:hypothetical protein